MKISQSHSNLQNGKLYKFEFKKCLIALLIEAILMDCHVHAGLLCGGIGSGGKGLIQECKEGAGGVPFSIYRYGHEIEMSQSKLSGPNNCNYLQRF